MWDLVFKNEKAVSNAGLKFIKVFRLNLKSSARNRDVIALNGEIT